MCYRRRRPSSLDAHRSRCLRHWRFTIVTFVTLPAMTRSEEHTSELQSPCKIVCRLLLEEMEEFGLPRHHDKYWPDSPTTSRDEYYRRMFDQVAESCFFNDTATTEIYTLSLHDALPI